MIQFFILLLPTLLLLAYVADRHAFALRVRHQLWLLGIQLAHEHVYPQRYPAAYGGITLYISAFVVLILEQAINYPARSGRSVRPSWKSHSEL